MKVQITVDDEMWKQAKASAALRGVTLGELVGEALGKIAEAVVSNSKAAATASKRVVVASEPVGVGETRTHPPVKRDPRQPPYDRFSVECPTETPMTKCSKCLEKFALVDMVTEPKSGKLYCQDCVDNMKNGQ